MGKSFLILCVWVCVGACVSGGNKAGGDNDSVMDVGVIVDVDMTPDANSSPPDDTQPDGNASIDDSTGFDTAADSQLEQDAPPTEDTVVEDVASEDIADITPPPPLVNGSPGCSALEPGSTGGMQISHTFSDKAGGERSYYLSVPKSYDPSKPQRLMVGFAGTNWLGVQIKPYLGLEQTAPQEGEIYVYPDLEWHDFPSWGNLGGWLLGPHAGPAKGNDDIEFTRELVELLGEEYCIDTDRIFATGHSWGGDMAAVAGCFLGDIFRAVAPAAANRPYWFDAPGGQVGCVSHAAVWTFFGQSTHDPARHAWPLNSFHKANI